MEDAELKVSEVSILTWWVAGAALAYAETVSAIYLLMVEPEVLAQYLAVVEAALEDD